MENKTELINTILDCVNDSVDLESNNVSLGILITLLNDNIPKQLTIGGVSQQRELLEWLSSEDYFNIPKDEISEILEDWQTYNSNCG